MNEHRDSIDGISVYLKDEFGMNDQEVDEILDIFFEECEEILRNMLQSIKGSKYDEVVSHAHALKGSSANINASMISEFALCIESSAKATEFSKINDIFPLLEKSFKSLQKEYEAKK